MHNVQEIHVHYYYVAHVHVALHIAQHSLLEVPKQQTCTCTCMKCRYSTSNMYSITAYSAYVSFASNKLQCTARTAFAHTCTYTCTSHMLSWLCTATIYMYSPIFGLIAYSLCTLQGDHFTCYEMSCWLCIRSWQCGQQHTLTGHIMIHTNAGVQG